jgi:hypothetical protein
MAKFDFAFVTRRFVTVFGAALVIITGAVLKPDAYGSFALHPQSPTATLSGVVVDESDALVRSVNITVTNADTALRRETITNGDGYFSVTLLPPGHYAVSAQHRGFTTAEVRNLKLNVGDQLTIKIQLKVGSLSESIIIEGASVIQGESAGVRTVIDRQFVENLPLNGRSFSTLVELTPGVVLTK